MITVVSGLLKFRRDSILPVMHVLSEIATGAQYRDLE